MSNRSERDGDIGSFNRKSPSCVVNIGRRTGSSASGSPASQTRLGPTPEATRQQHSLPDQEDESKLPKRQLPIPPTASTPSAPTPTPPVGVDIEESKRRGKIQIPLSKSGKPTRYYRCAPLTKLKHPLEENIFTSLLITLVAVSVAIVCGIPVLILTGALLLVAIILRYFTVIAEGCYQYLRFICSNRNVPANRTRPQIFPVDRLALANDVRWLGERSGNKCQSVLHTVLVFEGALELTHLRQLVTSRVLRAETRDGDLLYPRLTQKVVPIIGGYRWEPDSKFDVQNHIFNGPPTIKTEAQFQRHLGALMTENLELDKPLWEIRLFSNYGGQRDTMALLRVHQCLADGMTLVRILSMSLADRQQLHIPQRPHFAGLSFGFNVLRSFIVGPLTVFLWLCATSRDINFFSKPLPQNKSLMSAASCKYAAGKKKDTEASKKPMTQLLRSNDRSRRHHYQPQTPKETNQVPLLGSSTPPTGVKVIERTAGISTPESNQPDPLQKQPKVKSESNVPSSSKDGGPGWRVGWSAAMALGKVSRVKQIMRSSLNDVLLSAAAGSVRKYIQCQGIQYPNDLKVVIPVDLRNDIASPKAGNKLGCKVACILATVPAGVESAIPRLWATRHRLDEVKASADPVVAYGATTVFMNLLPQSLGSSVLDSITNKASFQFCNLAGPTNTLVIGGYALKGIYPFYPPSGKIRVAVTVFTYADQVHVTALAHRSLPNACNSLLAGMALEVDQLSRQLSHRRVPGESRRSARNSSTTNTEITKPPTKQIHIKLQVVQEELRSLTNQLDHPSDSLYVRQPGDETPGSSGSTQLKSRLKSLKNEFSDLIGELRRRSSIVEGMTLSFEDEETEDQFRKPRKRALSVVSVSRRNSLFAPPRHLLSSESSHSFRSDDEEEDEDLMTSSPSSGERHIYSPTLRHSSSPIRTTAV